ncbi:MAG: type 2 isopentenyl-diphosphate Delta-isomerase, partial [Planctomycetes bacterium]|nr:type 2 isopentenyl-diphosphate Delta-isomerase [Planctomycetota bacterium]
MSPGSENDPSELPRRKSEHLALCATDGVAFRAKRTLFEEVDLVHCALPELALDEIDLSTELLGKTLRAPIVISSMTGGTSEAAAVSRDLARVAERLGLGFGVGSQRAMAVAPDVAWTFDVRDVAPNVLLFGNLGLVQARDMPTRAVRELCDRIGADALCLHLNPAMELVQAGGDRDFRRGRETLARLASELGIPIVVKETGAGLSRAVGRSVRELGIGAVDVSGAGGTSWVGVEATRAEDARARMVGEVLWDWGVPTAASVASAAE